MKTEENQIIKINIEPDTVDIIVQAIHESNKKLTETIIDQMVKHNLESTLKIVEDMQERKHNEEQKLYSLKQLSEVLNINYRTLLSYKLPFRKLGFKNQKMYCLSEVREYLRI